MVTDREIIDAAREAMGEYICPSMGLVSAIKALVKNYRDVSKTKSIFQCELNEAEDRVANLESKMYAITRHAKDIQEITGIL